MKYSYAYLGKFSRLLIIIAALCIYIGIEIANALEMFYGPVSSFSIAWLSFIFGLSSLTSFIFLAVGSLVWVYARERRVAYLLFIYSIAMMITFTSFANLNANQMFSSLGKIAALVALTLVSIIFFYFPQNIFVIANRHFIRGKVFLASYLFLSSIFTLICSLIELNVFGIYNLRQFVFFYYILGFCTMLGITVFSYSKVRMGRKKQQMRIFVY